jgi:hypothetical protein
MISVFNCIFVGLSVLVAPSAQDPFNGEGVGMPPGSFAWESIAQAGVDVKTLPSAFAAKAKRG